MDRSFFDVVQTLPTIPNQTIAANDTVAGAAVDCAESDGAKIQFVLAHGTYVDGDHIVEFWHREAAADPWVQVPASLLEDPASVLTDNEVVVDDDTEDGTFAQIGYTGGKRFVKADVVSTNVTDGVEIAVAVQLGNLRSVGKSPMSPSWQ